MLLFHGWMLKDPTEPNSVVAVKEAASFFETSEQTFQITRF